jgi:hypothetical protein
MNVGALEEIHTKIYQNNDLENQNSTQSWDDEEDDDDTARSEDDGMDKTPIYQMNEQNRQDIIKLQKHCPSFKHMYHFLKDGILPEDPDKAKSIPYEYNTYVLLNDVSYHIWTTKIRKKNRESDIVQQLAVSTPLRNDILLSFHDSRAGGCHMGSQKSYAAIRQKYYWPRMYQHIHDYILSCTTCQLIKRDTHPKKIKMHPLPVQDVFSRWLVDILSGLPESKLGHRHILLMIDNFSHWCECVPLQTQHAVQVAKALYNYFFLPDMECALPFCLIEARILLPVLFLPFVTYSKSPE